jgi:hypothetical protein
MLRQHIACQAARPIRNKCRGRVTQRPYVRLRPLAYVTGSRPRGSIGSPPERGAGAYATWSEHVLVPDPHLTLIKAWVSFAPEPRDLAASGPDPARGGGGGSGGSSQGSRHACGDSGPYPGSGPCIKGSDTFPWGSRPTVDIQGYIVFFGHVAALQLSTWWGQVPFATRLKIAAWTPHLHTVVTGTPFPMY